MAARHSRKTLRKTIISYFLKDAERTTAKVLKSQSMFE